MAIDTENGLDLPCNVALRGNVALVAGEAEDLLGDDVALHL